MFFAPKPPKVTPAGDRPSAPAAPAAPLSFAATPMRPATQPTTTVPTQPAPQSPLPDLPEPMSVEPFTEPVRPLAPVQPQAPVPVVTEEVVAPVEPETEAFEPLPELPDLPEEIEPDFPTEPVAPVAPVEAVEPVQQEETPNIFSPATPPPVFDDDDAPLLDDPVFGTDEAVFETQEETLLNPMDVLPESEVPAPVVEKSKPVSAFAPPSDYEDHRSATAAPIDTFQREYLEPQVEKTETGKVLRAASLKDVPFADIWVTPENVSYVRDDDTSFALIPIETHDMDDFKKLLEEGYTGASSYALKFGDESYRVERITTTTGIQYNCRKMPTETPDVYSLGLPKATIDYLVGLSREAGLILIGGPTGMGKTTTASALLHKYLENDGGFMYTVEDPPEMPLDGVYHAKNGGLGLCKQTPVENERWEDGLKSALRSRPRYILVGEIRTPEVASQVLRAATSGHLVLSTIHANSVEDSLNSLIKYASGAGLAESLVSDLLARGILAVVHQKLEGTKQLRPVIHTCFANPNPLVADQMRMAIRDGKISLSTLMEAQATKLALGRPLYREL